MTSNNRRRKSRSSGNRTSWDPLAAWYDGWVGKDGSKHHRHVAIPELLKLLDLQAEEKLLDLGAGQGVLAPYVAEAGASYVGVDLSPRLIELARSRHGKEGQFIQGDASKVASLPGMKAGSFDAVSFLLSIQDMDPLEPVLQAAAWAVREGGRVVILMTHPCFRVPRQSGWGWDTGRKLQYRRVDRYLTPLAVPMKSYSADRSSGRSSRRQNEGVSRSFHRPISEYVNGLSAQGLWVNCLEEIPTYKVGSNSGAGRGKGNKQRAKAEERANEEIPLFLGLRAVKVK